MKKSDVVVDLTRITKRQLLEWRRGRREIMNGDSGDPFTLEQFDFDNLYGLVITSWPFGEVNFETYLDLSYPDSVAVENYVAEMANMLNEKK